MLAPNTISEADAPRKSASAARDEAISRVGLFAGRVVPVGVRVVVVEVVRHRVDDGGRHLGAAWTIEIRYGVAAVLALESWKLGADVDGRVRHLGSSAGR